MNKRLFNLTPNEMLNLNKEELLLSIKASEGRTIMPESIVSLEPPTYGVTGAEIARAFGGDLILLNLVDVFNVEIKNMIKSNDIIRDLRKLIGRPIGLNLEPVEKDANMMESITEISKGRIATKESIKKADELGFDFVCFTGNPGTGVTNKKIIESIEMAKNFFSGIIIAGKMHSSGVQENILDLRAIEEFIKKGADIILLPALYTAPSVSESDLREAVNLIHSNGKLALASIGTSQEGSQVDVIREIALKSKSIGFDIHHIGDSGYGGIANWENILELSRTIRGNRHTISMISRSILR